MVACLISSLEVQQMPLTWGFELFNYVSTSAIVLLVSNVLLAVFFLFIYRQKRQEYLLVWSGAWLLTSLHFLSSHFDMPGAQSWFEALNEWLLVAAALAFYVAARLYARFTLVATNAIDRRGGSRRCLGLRLRLWLLGRSRQSGRRSGFFPGSADLLAGGPQAGVTRGPASCHHIWSWGLICVAIAFRQRMRLSAGQRPTCADVASAAFRRYSHGNGRLRRGAPAR